MQLPTITAAHARELVTAPGNPHLVAVADQAYVVDGAYCKAYLPGVSIITTQADLLEIDPEAVGYTGETLAELLIEVYAEDFAQKSAPPRRGVLMRCPECSEQVRWGWHPVGLPGARGCGWVHRDGWPLCPVMGPDGYQSAEAAPAFR